MSDGVRMPRLLDANLQEARRLRPTALSLNLNRRAISTAQITLPGEDEALPLMGFVEMYLRRGGAGIFRVKETSQAAKGGNTRTYALSHAISTLHDSVWRAQEDFSGTVTAFLTQLLGYQQTARWQLGTVQDTSQWKKSGINYDHLDTLLYELAADRKDYLLTFDFSTSPWTLNFVQASGQVDCEMRRTRNLSDAQARGSLEGMCNRLYLTVHSTAQSQEDATVTEPTTQLLTYNDTASQAEFGIIEDTADIDTADVPDVAAWVAAFFQEHAAPQRQTSADGYEVVKSTGEPFDRFDLGKRCRIPALNVEGPVESIRFDNLLSDPDKARLDLNQKQQSATGRLHSLKEQARAAASSARSAGYAAKKNAADVEKHYKHAVNVTDQGMEDCFGVIGVKLDAQHKPIKDAQGNYVWAGPSDSPAEIWNHLHRNAWSNQILNHIKDANGNIISLAEVYTDAYGRVIINAINDQRTGTAAINANRIKLSATDTITLDAKLGILANGRLRVSGTLDVEDDVFIGDNLYVGEDLVLSDGYTITFSGPYDDLTFYPRTARFGNFAVSKQILAHDDLKVGLDAVVNGGQIEIKFADNSDGNHNSANFNIAATQYYIDGVAAARTQGQQDHTASSISGITIYAADAGQVVTKYPYVTYSNGDASSSLAMTVDCTAVSGGGPTSDNIDLANSGQIWLHTTDPGSEYVNLGSLGSRITEGKDNGSAYVSFQATCDGGVTYKYYKIPL